MNIVLFYHSLLSDWNHGNAHFLRGYATELILRGHTVKIFEPEDSWSYINLAADYGESSIKEFYDYYPHLKSSRYNDNGFSVQEELKDADLVIVHEWNTHKLVKEIGDYRKQHSHFMLLFHDTHHRIISAPEEMRKYDLSNYDGVLAFGKAIRDIYLQQGLVKNVWVWHEAADTRIFYPMNSNTEGDIVWIGNWGDDERVEELKEFLVEPVRELGLKCRVYGVRYPDSALELFDKAGIEFGGWLPNYKVPEVFSKYVLTLHIPRRPYVKMLPGIPTIRPFEALASGIPMISSPWQDSEHLFRPGEDFLFVQSRDEMRNTIEIMINDQEKRNSIINSGLSTISERHTCSRRVDELLSICESPELNTIYNSKEN